MSALIVLLALSAPTQSESFVTHGAQVKAEDGLDLGGDIWIDSGYETLQQELDSEPDRDVVIMSGRLMLQARATYTIGDFFGQAQGQILAQVNELPGAEQLIDTDDAWIKFGLWDWFDVQVGRFEAWEVYHKGQGLERDTLEDLGAFDGADIYEVNYAYYRQDGFGQAALHVYPHDLVRFEVHGVFGNELGSNAWGIRPAAILDFDQVKVKLAAEWRRRQNEKEDSKEWEERYGLGGSVQLFFDEHEVWKVQAGVNGAYGIVDLVDPFGNVSETGSPDTLSLGGFVNLGIYEASLGLGYNHTIRGDRQYNDQRDTEGKFVHQQAFVSVMHPIVLDRLTAKIVAAYARAELEPAFDNARTNEMYSVRLRLAFSY